MKHGDQIKRDILRMGVQLWSVDPSYVSARRIASELNMTHANVLYHFKHTQGLKDAIAFYAVKNGESRVIIHLIAMNHHAVAAMSDDERRQHMDLVRGQHK